LAAEASQSGLGSRHGTAIFTRSVRAENAMPDPADSRDPDDPKGLIRESYRIEGIGLAECRSIFLDWAISLPPGAEAHAAIPDLLDLYGSDAPDHPMTAVLREGLPPPVPGGRRGGRRGRAGG
jgi:hypothetical protein